MATVSTIIDRAIRLLGETGAGEYPTAQEYADALVALNDLLDDWRNERLMVNAIQDETVTMVAAQSSYTIGPGGDLSTTRPVRIEDAYVVSSTTSIEVRMIEEDEYDALPDKTSTSTWPRKALYRPTMPTGTLIVYPVPTAASALHIKTWTPIAAFAAITDTISLQPGYSKALAANLAIELAPEYETDPRQSVVKMAIDSKANIKRVNVRPIKGTSELARLVGPRRSNILTGTT